MLRKLRAPSQPISQRGGLQKMAVRLSDTIKEMQRLVAEPQTAQPALRARQILDLAADFLRRALAQDAKGQVAILMRVPGADHLAFAYPQHLTEGNALPLERQSIAGRVMLDREVVVENNVPEEPHQGIFELIPDPNGEVRTIQKMLAAPILAAGGEPMGVIEVSRTGSSSASAGPDFTAEDGKNLAHCCRAFAPYIARHWQQARA